MSTHSGPVTVLTGASSGLGAALAPLLARDGGPVVLAARRLEKLESVAAAVRAAGGEADPVALDVGDRDAVRAAFADILERHGRVDRLICNAGRSGMLHADSFDAGVLEATFATNLFGVGYCVEQVLPGMLARRSGHIVGVSSLAGLRGLPGSGAYNASKAALTNLLEGLRIECRPLGIAVTTIHPGFVKTPMTATNTFPMPFLMEVEDAAEAMYRGIRRRSAEVSFPWQLVSVVKAARWVPNGLYDRALQGQRSGKTDPTE